MSEQKNKQKDDDEKFALNAILEHYKLLANFIQYQHIIKWTIFSIFILFNGILIQTISGLYFDEYDTEINYKILYNFIIVIFGIIISIAWYLINERSGRYVLLRRNKAKKVWNNILLKEIKCGINNKFKSCKIENDDLRLFEKKGLEGLSASTISNFIIKIIMISWIIYLILLSVFTIYINFFV